MRGWVLALVLSLVCVAGAIGLRCSRGSHSRTAGVSGASEGLDPGSLRLRLVQVDGEPVDGLALRWTRGVPLVPGETTIVERVPAEDARIAASGEGGCVEGGVSLAFEHGRARDSRVYALALPRGGTLSSY